jgi:hypothetical protein
MGTHRNPLRRRMTAVRSSKGEGKESKGERKSARLKEGRTTADEQTNLRV